MRGKVRERKKVLRKVRGRKKMLQKVRERTKKCVKKEENKQNYSKKKKYKWKKVNKTILYLNNTEKSNFFTRILGRKTRF